MGCLQSSNSVNVAVSKEQKSALVTANPADSPSNSTDKNGSRKPEYSSLQLNNGLKKDVSADPAKLEELRQPVKRREFANDEQGSAFDILKKRVQSRRHDMNAHQDDDHHDDNNSAFD